MIAPNKVTLLVLLYNTQKSTGYFEELRSENQESRIDNLISTPEWIRTTDPQLRRLLLYPTELRAQIKLSMFNYQFLIKQRELQK
jgi:hypothetical protein